MSSGIMTGVGGSLKQEKCSGSSLHILVYTSQYFVYFLPFSIFSSLGDKKKLQFGVFRLQKFTKISFDPGIPIGILETVLKILLLGLHEQVLNRLKYIDLSLPKVAYVFLFCRKDLFNLCRKYFGYAQRLFKPCNSLFSGCVVNSSIES